MLGGTKPTAWLATVRAGNAYLLEELHPSSEQEGEAYKLVFERLVTTFDTPGLWALLVFFYDQEGRMVSCSDMVPREGSPIVSQGNFLLRVAYELNIGNCPACSGSGTFVWTQMGREYRETCANCEGTGKVLDDE